MAMPEQIRKQIEAAEEKMKEISGSQEVDATDPDGAPASSEATSTSQANGAGKSVQPAGTTEHGAGEDPNSETYAQRWRTLQGQFNAEVPRLRGANKDLQTRIAQLENLLSSINNTPTAAPAAPQSGHKFVTDDDVAEYGDSIDMMRKVTREEVGSLQGKIAQLEGVIANLSQSMSGSVIPQVQRVAQQQAASAEERFWGNLAQRVPNWQQINNDQDFQSWLLDIDPLTNTSRQTHLEIAQRDLDANRVVAFFNAFTSASGKFAPQANAQPNRSASELEKQIAPGRSRGSAGGTAGQTAKTYTPSDITKFFNDVRSGRYNGRETERDRIERDIFAAQREGRIMQAS
jgi:cell division septum initiation protein DivIVA